MLNYIKIPSSIVLSYWDEIVEEQDLNINEFYVLKDDLDNEYPYGVYVKEGDKYISFGDRFESLDFIEE
jgi:hypothetical protein